MTKYYISGVGKIGTLAYSAKQPDGTNRSYIEAESEAAAIAVFKKYAEEMSGRLGSVGIDEELVSLMISSDGRAA